MRIYKNKYLSVTSVIDLKDPFDDRAFREWCTRMGKNKELISATSRILGQKVSDFFDSSFSGLEAISAPLVDKLECNLITACENFLEEYDILDCEREVYCDEFNYAGKYDGKVANKKTGKKFLVDWKTYGAWKDSPYKEDPSKVKHARWQTTLYKYADKWEDDIAVAIFKNDGTWELKPLKYDTKILAWVKDNQPLILKTINGFKYT